MNAHWAEFGRNYYSRHDYEGVDKAAAEALIADLRGRLDKLAGLPAGPLTVTQAEDFSYTDPVDGSVTAAQGIQIMFEGGARLVLRLSGTGTEGATLRVYMESFESTDFDMDPQTALGDLVLAAEALAGIKIRLGRDAPDVVT